MTQTFEESSRHSTGRSSVGQPIAEAGLTSAVLQHARTLVSPGPGRVLLTLSEVELGLGRPDVVLLTASLTGLAARARQGLRLANLTEAQVLVSVDGRLATQHSESHVRTVTRRLAENGWLTRTGQLRAVPRLVAQSLLIEAKVRDWRNGVGQLTRTRWVAQRSALLVPAATSHLVPRAMLRHNRLGLIVERSDGSLRWEVRTRPRQLSPLADVWLTELAIRHLERTGSLDVFRLGE